MSSMSSAVATINTGSSSNAITSPIWLNNNCHTQNILTCSVCCDIALDPVVTPCHHIFCRTCISQSLRRNKFCPNDRKPLRAQQLKVLDGPIKRVWSETPVKCPGCQIWTGSLQSYYSGHGLSCTNPQKRIAELEEKLKDAETQLCTTTEEMQGQIKALEEKLKLSLQSSPEEIYIPSKRSSGHLTGRTFYSSNSGPFGPFGTQLQKQQTQNFFDSFHQQQESIIFGQSTSNVRAASSNFSPFGSTNDVTPALSTNMTNHSRATPASWVANSAPEALVQFSIGIAGHQTRRKFRSRCVSR